jgi:L-rhamnose-H+ transport protein
MHIEQGLLITILAGIMVGNCMLPINYMRKWRWENIWIVFSLVALVLIPWTLAFLRVPDLMSTYGSVRFSAFAMPALYGAGWGVAQVLFGLAVKRIGMALSFAVTIGLSAALGTLVPILAKHPEVVVTARGAYLLTGLLLMLAGVVVCSWAGRRREQERRDDTADSRGQFYLVGIVLATAAGLLAPMLNYALVFGDPLILEAIRHNTASADAPYAVWPVALAGGAIPNIGYALWLLYRNESWRNFFPVWPEILLGTIMGVLWMGSVAAYGTATTLLGVLGASIGWSIYQTCIILTANVSGWITGEWSGASFHSKFALWSGLFLLGSAMFAISVGSQ